MRYEMVCWGLESMAPKSPKLRRGDRLCLALHCNEMVKA